MEQSKPTYFFISVGFVGAAILFMYLLKNVFHIEPFPEGRVDSDPFTIQNKEYLQYERQNPTKLEPVPEEGGAETNDDEPDTGNEMPEQIEEESSEPAETPRESDPPIANEEEADPVPNSGPTEDPTGTSAYFDQLFADYRNEVIATMPDGQNRTDVVVRYYNRKADANRIDALKRLRFYIHERPVEDPQSMESNSIYYGDSVRTRDIQMIAFTLVQNGLNVKQIVPSKFHDSWKASSVEIGADAEATRLPNLTLSDIRQFSNEFYSN